MNETYFGLIGNSFYAGPNGKSFSIAGRFKHKFYESGQEDNDSLDYDLTKGWASSVQPGDYAFIAYGYPGDDLDEHGENEYIRNKEIDDPDNYNGTLWQKKYENGDFSYELIVTLQGATPYITFTANELDASADPKVTIEGPTGNLDTPNYTLGIAKPWNIVKGVFTPLNANAEPTVVLNQKADNDEDEDDPNIKYLHMGIPKAWNIGLGTVTPGHAGNPPVVTLNSDNNTSTKTLSFTLPNAWEIDFTSDIDYAANEDPFLEEKTQEDVDTKSYVLHLPKAYQFSSSYAVTSAGTQPSVALGELQDGYILPINFRLPAPWQILVEEGSRVSSEAAPIWTYDTSDANNTKRYVIQLPNGKKLDLGTTQWLAPDSNPEVTLSDIVTDTEHHIDTRTLTFSLPKAWQLEITGNADLDADEIAYIENPIIKAGTNDTKIWTIHLPKAYKISAINGTPLSASSTPQVTQGSLSADGQTIPLTFQFPIPWSINATALSVIPSSSPSVSVDTNGNTRVFTFSLPRAVAINHGIGAPDSINEDDYYIDTNTGDFYGYDSSVQTTHAVKLFSFTPTLITDDPFQQWVNPYVHNNNVWSKVNPSVILTNLGSSTWQFDFALPALPNFVVGSTATSGIGTAAIVTAEITDVDKMSFNFTIPKGTYWFTGTSSPSASNTITEGDLFYNTNNTKVYKRINNAWVEQSWTIKGEQGDGVKIVGKMWIDYHDNYLAAYKDGDPIPTQGQIGYIDSTNPIFNEQDRLVQISELLAIIYAGSLPQSDEMINVIMQDYRDPDGGQELVNPLQSSYWSYYLSPSWHVTPIAGGVDSRLVWGTWDSTGLHQ